MDKPVSSLGDLARLLPPDPDGAPSRHLYLLIELWREKPDEPLVAAICLTREEMFRRKQEYLDQLGDRAEEVTLVMQAFPIGV